MKQSNINWNLQGWLLYSSSALIFLIIFTFNDILLILENFFSIRFQYLFWFLCHIFCKLLWACKQTLIIFGAFPREISCNEPEIRRSRDFKTDQTLYLTPKFFVMLSSFDVNQNSHMFNHVSFNDQLWIVGSPSPAFWKENNFVETNVISDLDV